jgi:Tfp pilus assembly protein PilP
MCPFTEEQVMRTVKIGEKTGANQLQIVKIEDQMMHLS